MSGARRLRALRRLARALAQLAGGLAIVSWRFPRLDAAARRDEVRRWSLRVLRALDVALVVEGEPAPDGALLVANHVSWLDIVAIDAVRPARFVAKAEVRGWPLVGRLVTAGGTLYLARERSRDAHRVVHDVAAALAGGDTVAVFPEGAVGDGRALLPFHANLLQAAVATCAPVQPVALRYFDARHAVSPAADFAGSVSLVASAWRIACADGFGVGVRWLAPETADGRTRRQLAAALRGRLAEALGETGEDVRPGPSAAAAAAAGGRAVPPAPSATATIGFPASSEGLPP